MKFCQNCGDEIYTRDGENQCQQCSDRERGEAKKGKRRQARKLREQAMKDLGLVKVRGAMGGTYWE